MSKDKPTNMAASVRQKLLNLAQARKDDFQLVLIRYGLERLLYRLSLSSHRDRFVLKGAMLFQAWTGQLYRSTLDLDLHGTGDSAVNKIVDVFRDVCRQPIGDDGLTFDARSVNGENIREDQEYDGVRIHIAATLGVAKVPIQIDIGFGDAITPKAKRIKYPSLLGLPMPSIRAYPKETVVAEKYQAMVFLGIANSRMKDFFDVWVLATTTDFEGAVLSRAIGATFARRRTLLPPGSPLALTDAFAKDPAKQTQWHAFVKKGRLAVETVGFDEVVAKLGKFLLPPTQALAAGVGFEKNWPMDGPWA